jgi:hypothetical protein
VSDTASEPSDESEGVSDTPEAVVEEPVAEATIDENGETEEAAEETKEES